MVITTGLPDIIVVWNYCANVVVLRSKKRRVSIPFRGIPSFRPAILDDFLRENSVIDVREFVHVLLDKALYYKPFWDKANLQTLCRSCNWYKHLCTTQNPT